MKVVHVNISDYAGGVGKASYRLHTGLLQSGVDSKLLVENRRYNHSSILTSKSTISRLYNKCRARLDKLPHIFTKSTHWEYASSNYLPNPWILKAIRKCAPDLIHLHWIGDGLFPIHYFSEFSGIPIVATLHGRWLFNGAQHLHADSSMRFIEGFRSDNRDDEDGGWDIDRWVWKRKNEHLEKADVNVVVLSRWMEKDARRSFLLKRKPITRIPNGLDTTRFTIGAKQSLREKWNIGLGKKVVLFGANFATQDRNKGFGDFVSAVKHLEANRGDFQVVVFGSDHPGEKLPFEVETTFVGFISEEEQLAEIYALADLFVLPSKQDNLPNTVMEALSCGTPVVAYDVGGVSDLVIHQKNGYLASPGDPIDLSNGLKWLLALESNEYSELSTNARDHICLNFNQSLQVTEMISLYREILSSKGK